MIRLATATITRWIDGDTLVVDAISPGWGVRIEPTHPSDKRCHVRLAGVNAPDKKADAKWDDPALARKAADYASATWPAGTSLALTSYGFDDFGRTIADVSADGQDIGATLVSLGYARTGDYPMPVAEA